MWQHGYNGYNLQWTASSSGIITIHMAYNFQWTAASSGSIIIHMAYNFRQVYTIEIY